MENQHETQVDKSTLLRAFNNLFFDFINDIIQVFPENTDLVYAKKSFETIKKMNPTMIAKSWYTFVYHPYKDVIESGDISFFFDKDYKSDLTTVKNANEIMKMIDKIREPIKNMGVSNMAHTTKYIQNLSKLSLHYAGNDA
jgi:hypothetical protein